jgi:hypothetical protein
LTRKTRRQPDASTSSEPTVGPAAAAAPPTAARIPSAPIRRLSGTDAISSDCAEGTRAAAPMPWRARAAISTATDGAAAQPAEAPMKTTIPLTKTRRAPTRSATRPSGTSSAAKMML